MSRLVPKYVMQQFRISFVMCFLITLTAGVSFPFLQPVIPVFYSLSQPEKQLVNKIWIFLFPAFSWLILFINSLLIRMFQEIEGNMQKTFAWTTVGAIAITGILLIRVITIIT